MQVSQEAENSNSKARTVSDESEVSIVKHEVDTVTSGIADVIGMEYTTEEESRLVLGDGLANYDVAIVSSASEDELEAKYSGLNSLSTADISDYNMVNVDGLESASVEVSSSYELVARNDVTSYRGPSDEKSTVNTYDKGIKISVTNIEVNGYVLLNNSAYDEWVLRDALCTEQEFNKAKQGTALLEISNPDESYTGQAVSLTAEDRDILERLVMGEAGGQGFEGAALVAQCIRDTMVYKGYTSVESVRKSCGYSGSLKKTPNQDTLDAVAYIFDDGGYVVRHKVFYFYAYTWSTSSWHETRPFVIQYGGHRVFA